MADLVYRWRDSLWTHFRPQLKKGHPFYLAVDSCLIKKLHAEISGADTDARSAVSAFQNVCRLLFVIRANRLELLPSALIPDKSSKSLAIVLAAQQVLVVESMLFDDAFSQEAYYPRYHAALAYRSATPFRNPLKSSEDFQAIWEQLAEELSSEVGNDRSIITFRKGPGRKDMNRGYPLSQALLTTDDLTSLVSSLSAAPEDCLEDAVLLTELRSHYKALSTRGRKIVFNQYLASSLTAQVRAFKSPDPGSRFPLQQPPAATSAQINLALQITEDLFGETYHLVLYESLTNQVGGIEALNAAQERLKQESALVFSNTGLQYVQTLPADLHEDVEVLVLQQEEQLSQLIAQLGRCGLPPSILQPVEASHLSPLKLSRVSDSKPFINFLKVLKFGSNFIKRGIEFKGGYHIDERKNLYLTGYAPSSMMLEGHPVSDDTPLLVNHTKCTVREFFRQLQTAQGIQIFELQFSGNVTHISVQPTPLLETCDVPQIGFPITEDGFLCPSTAEISSDRHVFGFTLINPRIEEGRQTPACLSISKYLLGALLSDTAGPWIVASESERSMVISMIKTSVPQSGYREYLLHKLRIRRTLPPLILAALRR